MNLHEEYEKSRELLGLLEEDQLAADIVQFVDYLQNQNLNDEQLEELFIQMETDAEGNEFWDGERYQELFRAKVELLHQETESTIEEETTCVEN